MKPIDFEIISGTYEEFLLGYTFVAKHLELTQSFASHDHSSSIRSLAISGRYLASGAADDRIIVYDLKTRKEHCMLTHHSSTVNSIEFTTNHSHVISGSADGVLAVVRVGNWQLEKVWNKPRKGSAILDIALHSSGKLALTLSADASLRTWNLVKGRQAFIVNLNSKSKDARSLEKILWAEDNIRFLLYGGKYTEVWSINTGGILKVIEHDQRVTSCIWISDSGLLVGYEGGEIVEVNVDDCSKTARKGHVGRVKALAKYKKWIVSASSSGEIKVWNRNLDELASVNSGCRITCLKIVPPLQVKKEKENKTIEEDTMPKVATKVTTSSVIVVEMEGSDEETAGFINNTKTNKYVVKESKTKESKKKKRKKIKDDRYQE